jgi:hypothetical protein
VVFGALLFLSKLWLGFLVVGETICDCANAPIVQMSPLQNALSLPPSNRPLRNTPPKLSPVFDGALSSASCILQVRPPVHHVLHHYFDNNCIPQPDGTVILSLASDHVIRIITITSPSGTWQDPFASLLAEIPLEGCVASFIIRPSISHVLPYFSF